MVRSSKNASLDASLRGLVVIETSTTRSVCGIASLVYCCQANQYSVHKTERAFLDSIPEPNQTKLTRYTHEQIRQDRHHHRRHQRHRSGPGRGLPEGGV